MCIYNPLDEFYKSKSGAIKASDKITFRVKGDFGSVLFVFKNDSDNVENYLSMQKEQNVLVLNLIFLGGYIITDLLQTVWLSV